MFQRSRQGAVSVISGDTPLNSESSEPLRQLVADCLGDGPPRVLLDLQGVPLMDSVGLELLLDLQDLVEARTGSLKLCAPNPLCAEILQVTGVGNHFEVFAEVKAAIGSFV